MPGSAAISVFMTSCLLVLSAHAEDRSSAQVVERATQRHAELDFEGALELLSQAHETPGNSRALLTRIYYLQALCLGALERYDEARGAFAAVLALEPGFRISSNVSPRIRKPFEELLASRPQSLQLRVSPPTRAVRGEPLEFSLAVQSDPTGLIRTLRVWYGTTLDRDLTIVALDVEGAGSYQIAVPAAAWEDSAAQQLHWYAVVEGEHGSQLQQFGDAAQPLSLDIVDVGAAVATADGESEIWYESWGVWAAIGGGIAVIAAATGITVWVLQNANSDETVNIPIVTSTKS